MKADHDGKSPYPLPKANPARLGTLSVSRSERDLRRLTQGRRELLAMTADWKGQGGTWKKVEPGRGILGRCFQAQSLATPCGPHSPCRHKWHLSCRPRSGLLEKASGACASIPGPLHPVSRRLQETKDLLQPDFNKGSVVTPL